MSSAAPKCTHSTVRIFPNNVLPCPVVHQQNSRTTHGMIQPPLPTTYFLFDTNENPLNHLTPSKQRLVAISARYKFRRFARSPFRNSFARRAASGHSPLQAISRPTAHLASYRHSSLVAHLCASHCISNRETPELEPNVTRRKQTLAPRSNCQKMHSWKNPFSASDSPTQSTSHKSQVTTHTPRP
jgi:hypothetical protein